MGKREELIQRILYMIQAGLESNFDAGTIAHDVRSVLDDYDWGEP